MSELMLTQSDAVNICCEILSEYTRINAEHREWIEGEFKQKCWLTSLADTPINELYNLLCDVNPAEICAQIENDNLTKWCATVRINAQMLFQKIKENADDV
jgi:hypothetical protein